MDPEKKPPQPDKKTSKQEHEEVDEYVDEIVDESFPASDPPAWSVPRELERSRKERESRQERRP